MATAILIACWALNLVNRAVAAAAVAAAAAAAAASSTCLPLARRPLRRTAAAATLHFAPHPLLGEEGTILVLKSLFLT